MISASGIIAYSLLFLAYSAVLATITVLGTATIASVPPALQRGTGQIARWITAGWILLGYLTLLILILP